MDVKQKRKSRKSKKSFTNLIDKYVELKVAAEYNKLANSPNNKSNDKSNDKPNVSFELDKSTDKSFNTSRSLPLQIHLIISKYSYDVPDNNEDLLLFIEWMLQKIHKYNLDKESLVSSHNTEITYMNDKIQDLSNQISDLNNQIKTLKEKNSELQVRIEPLSSSKYE